MFDTVKERQEHYRDDIPFVFGATADLYYAYWGEFFHLAIFEEGEDPEDLSSVSNVHMSAISRRSRGLRPGAF
jgi:hypothetical protein